MRASLTAALVGTTLVVTIPEAVAGTIAWTDPATRALQISWSSQAARDLAKVLLPGKHELSDDADPRRLGPGGGVLLHSYNGIFLELDPQSGLIEALRKDADGTLLRRVLVDVFAAGPSVFKKGGDTEVMVTLSVAAAANGASLLSKDAPTTRTRFLVDVVRYQVVKGTPQVVDRAQLAYDASTLRPTLSAKKAKEYTEPYLGNGGPLVYWNLGAAPTGWYTPATYWDAPVSVEK
ncbi:MAG: hypothetical protein H6732_13360 [Alphaproteobacteria bacterium]|nr:hypothetical protein [Alphaproteobacteria bacterium]